MAISESKLAKRAFQAKKAAANQRLGYGCGGRVKMANGGPSDRFLAMHNELTRGRSGPGNVIFGSAPLGPQDISAANPSPALTQGGLASRPWAAMQPVGDVASLGGVGATPGVFSFIERPPGMADGGKVKKQGKGLIKGPGTPTSDSIPVDLPSGAQIAASDTEYILPADTVRAVGVKKLDKLVDETHTPVKGAFGMANGYSVSEYLNEDIARATEDLKAQMGRPKPVAASPTAPPAPPPTYPVEEIPQPKVYRSGRVPPGTPQPAPPGTKFFDPNAVRQPLPNASTGFNPDGTMKSEAAMSAKNNAISQGLAKEGGGIGQGEAPANKLGKAAQVRGKIASVINPDMAGLAKGALGAAKLNLAAAVPLGAVSAATDSPEDIAKFNATLGGGDEFKSVARYLERIGNTATFGYANKIGKGIASVIGGGSYADGYNDVQPEKFTPARDTAVGPPKPPAPPPSTVPLTSDQKIENWQKEKLTEMGVSPAEQARGPVTSQLLPGMDEVDQRRGFINGTVAPSIDRSRFSNLGDYGAPGTKIFGRSTLGPRGKINDFVGVGAGKPVPDTGVNFGFKPGEAKAAMAADAEARASFGAAQPPQYQESPETQKIRERIAELSTGPLTKRTARELAVLTNAANTASHLDDRKYAADTAAFGHARDIAREGKAERLAQARLGYDYDKLSADLKGKAAEAEVKRNDLIRTQGKDRMARFDKLAESTAAGLFSDEKQRAQYQGMLKMFLATKKFTGADGTPRLVYDFNDNEADALLGRLDDSVRRSMAEMAKKGVFDPNQPNDSRSATLWEALNMAASTMDPGLVKAQIFGGARASPTGDVVYRPSAFTTGIKEQ